MSDKEENQLQVINGNAPVVGGFHFAPGMKGDHWEVIPAGIIFKRGIDRDEWLKLAEQGIGDFEVARDNGVICMARVGDILNHGKLEFPEEYGQAIDSTSKAIRLSIKTLQNVQWIFGSVAPERRQLMLSVGHHEAVAKLTPKEQGKYLKDALENEWSVADLKAQIKKDHPNPDKKAPAGSKKIVVDLESEEGLLHAGEKILEFLEVETTAAEGKENVHPEDWTKERQKKWFPLVGAIAAIIGQAEEGARTCATIAAAYLDNPDNNPLAKYSDTRKAKWQTPLNDLAKAGRRMAVIGSAKPRPKKAKKGKEQIEPAAA